MNLIETEESPNISSKLNIFPIISARPIQKLNNTVSSKELLTNFSKINQYSKNSDISIDFSKISPLVFKLRNEQNLKGGDSEFSSMKNIQISQKELNTTLKTSKIPKNETNAISINLLVRVNRFVKYLINNSKFRKNGKLKEFHYDIIGDLSYISPDFNGNSINFCLKFLSNFRLLKFVKQFLLKINVFHPTGIFHIIFDLFMLINTIFYFLIIPLQLSFNINFIYLVDCSSFKGISSILSIFLFIIEILLNFNTSYYEKGELINDRSKIFKNYMKKQLVKDLFSIQYILLSVIVKSFTSYMNLTSIFYIFRYQNLYKIMHRIEEFLFLDDVNSNIFALFKLIFRVLLLSHMFACIWHYIGYSNIYAEINWLQADGLVSADWSIRYLESLYFIAVVTNTVGFGDIVPTNTDEKIFCIIFIYFACGLFAYTINSVGMFLHNINRSKLAYKSHMNILNGYLKQKNIGYALRMKLKNYFDYIYYEEKLKTSEDSIQVIKKLSNSLQEELLLNANGIHLRALSMFNDNFSESSLRKLTNEMKEINMIPGDIIYRQCDIEDPYLYIVKKGEVEMFLENPKEEITILGKVTQGETFGEFSFFTNLARESSARCSTFTSMFAIQLSEFIKIIKECDEDYETFYVIKEQIKSYQNYEKIGVKCYSCHESGHLILDCPYLNIGINKSQIIQKFLYSKSHNRKPFKRRHDKQCALKLYKKMQSFADVSKENENLSQEDNSNDENFEEIHFFLDDNIYNNKEYERNDTINSKTIKNITPGVFFEKAKEFNIFFPQNNIEDILEKYNSKRNKKRRFPIIFSDHSFSNKLKTQIPSRKGLTKFKRFFKINDFDAQSSSSSIEKGRKSLFYSINNNNNNGENATLKNNKINENRKENFIKAAISKIFKKSTKK